MVSLCTSSFFLWHKWLGSKRNRRKYVKLVNARIEAKERIA